MNTIGFLDTLCRNFRYALRALRHNPTFTVVALLTLAIGIGANTAVFSVVNSVLLKPLPYPKSEELVALSAYRSRSRGTGDDHRRVPPLGVHVFHVSPIRTGRFSPWRAWISEHGFRYRIGGTRAGAHGFDHRRHAPGARRRTRAGTLARRRPTKYPEVRKRSCSPTATGSGDSEADSSVHRTQPSTSTRAREIVGVMPQGFRFVNTDADLILPFAFDRSKLSLPGFSFAGHRPGSSQA